MERGVRVVGDRSSTSEPGGALVASGPGKRTLTMGLSQHGEPPHGRAPDSAGDEVVGSAPSTPGLGFDLTLDPKNDASRNTLDPDAETVTDAHERNPRVDGRPVDPSNLESGWGSPLGTCHGVVAFRNVIPEESERQRIAALHDNGQAGLDRFGLTVPFGGGLAYQCVEFVTRYYRDALGHTGLGGGNAQTFLQGSRGGLEVHRFPTPTRPQAGDLFVQEGGPSPVGHVAIVESVSGSPGSPVTVNVVQQNWTSATHSFTLPAGKAQQSPAPTISRDVDVYLSEGGWSGFRRMPGTTPVEHGGSSESEWLGAPDHGEGGYVVQPGEIVHLDTVARIYGRSVDELRQFNPGISDAVAPVNEAIEIRVMDSFSPSETVRGTATVNDGGANVRSAADATSAAIGHFDSGAIVMVYDVVVGQQVAGYSSQDWYKVAFYTGADAYVFGALCTGMPATSP